MSSNPLELALTASFSSAQQAVVISSKNDRQCQVSIVIPTLNEAENISILLPRLCSVLTEAEISSEVLIIDDDSQDGTESLCKDLSVYYPVRLIIRTGARGLASAVANGLSEARGSLVVVMDADLSHPPEVVPLLIDALKEEDTDFVIGSRYVRGGKTDEKWGLFRLVNSKVATWLARPLTDARDPMAGFFAIRRSTYLRGAARLDPIGYKIGLELIVKCHCKLIKEIPIQFKDRVQGKSKLTLKEQFNYLRHLSRLYAFRLGVMRQPVQFVLIGSSGMVLDLICFSMFLRFLPGSVARALAIFVAMTWNFAFNRAITFTEARNRPVMRQYLLFCSGCLLGAVLNWSTSVLLYSNVDFFTDHSIFAAFLGITSGTVFNYWFSKGVAFR